MRQTPPGSNAWAQTISTSVDHYRGHRTHASDQERAIRIGQASSEWQNHTRDLVRRARRLSAPELQSTISRLLARFAPKPSRALSRLRYHVLLLQPASSHGRCAGRRGPIHAHGASARTRDGPFRVALASSCSFFLLNEGAQYGIHPRLVTGTALLEPIDDVRVEPKR